MQSRVGALLMLLGAVPAYGAQELSVDRVFGDHMVLQRDQAIRVWGRANTGESVTVHLAQRSASGRADANGSWRVELEPLGAGGPHVLEVSSGTEILQLDDVLVGEVWLCAGQSNMRWNLRHAESAKRAVPAADVPGLRLYDMVGVQYPAAGAWDAEALARCTPEEYYLDAEWQVSSPETAATFSAVAYFFGRELHERLGVPVGLVHNAIGGACIEAYISHAGLAGHELLAGAVEDPRNWLDNPHIPTWCRDRARDNLSGWLASPTGEMPGHPFQPAFLFEAGVRPLTSLGLRGVVWYQGESNALADRVTATDPALCRAGIETLIADWRRAFGRPELPFLYVQLPGIGRPPWMEFRQVQRQVLETPNTGMAVTIDLGAAHDVHPRNKREVGRRLSLLAGAQVYGEDAYGARSPRPSSCRFESDSVAITFEDCAGGLRTSDNQALRGFELCGTDGVWRPATATVEERRVIVKSPAVQTPRAVRYAWAPMPDGNLTGGTGLPASPFVEGERPPFSTRTEDAPADPSVETRARTGFEDQPPGAFTLMRTGAGTWTASAGHAVVDDAHGKGGRQCLHLVGGEERRVVLTPTAIEDVDVITFWAERWTRRDPFVFRVEGLMNGEWRELYVGDDEVAVGGFRTHVRIPIAGLPERLRMTCTSPAGVLIDDLVMGRRRPMEVVTATATQTVMPCLVGKPDNPVAELRIETAGELDPLVVNEVHVDLRGTSALADVASVSLLGEDGTRLGEAQLAAAELVFRGALPLREGANTLRLAVSLAPTANLGHLVDAGFGSVRFTSDTVIEPEITHPPEVQRIGLALRDANDDGAAVYRIPGLATTPEGTLIAVYDVRWEGWSDLPGDIDVGMSRSVDGGRTWEPMRIVLDMGRDPEHRFDGVGDPAVLVDDTTGTIWVAATWSHGDRAWNGSGPGLKPEETGQLVLTRSDDDGLTWSQPINITAQVKRPEWCYLLAGPGRGITMRDRTLVFAAQYQDTPENGRLPYATLLTSRDHGETWELGTAAKPNTTEAQVVELEDGVLMLNMRDNRGGARSVATTRDLGRTWQAHPTSRKALIEPICNAALIRFGDDTLVFCNPDVLQAPRRAMTLKASTDLGTTWPAANRLLLDAGQSAGYPSLTRIDERTIGVLFEGSRAQLTFLRIPLADLIRGRVR